MKKTDKQIIKDLKAIIKNQEILIKKQAERISNMYNIDEYQKAMNEKDKDYNYIKMTSDATRIQLANYKGQVEVYERMSGSIEAKEQIITDGDIQRIIGIIDGQRNNYVDPETLLQKVRNVLDSNK